MKNQLKEYSPINSLENFINSFWFFRNNTGGAVDFPVVPDGCSDIIFYLNASSKLNDSNNTFMTGIMEFAELIPIPHKMEMFGIRFQPGVLSFFLNVSMKELKNQRHGLAGINKFIYQSLKIDKRAIDKSIVGNITPKIQNLLPKDILKDDFFRIMRVFNKNTDVSINELSLKSSFSLKNIERIFDKRVGLSPKKFTRIMRFQKAHKEISTKGLANLVTIALSSGYFDQAHFNREYKKLVGFNPTNETMSILYNTQKK